MRNRFWIPAAVTLALAAGTAHAQVFPNGAVNNFTPGFFNYSRQGGFTPRAGYGFGGNFAPQFQTANPGFGAGAFSGANPAFGAGAFGGVNPAFGAGAFGGQNPGFFQFDRGQGFSLRGDLVPSIGAGTTDPNATPTTVSPGPTVQNGYGYGGGGYYGNYYGGGYYPGGYYGNYYNTGDYPADYYGNDAPVVNPEAAGVPVAPGNVAEVAPPVNRPNASSRTPEERRAALAAARQERQADAAIQNQYQALAGSNGLASGTLISQRNGTARVRYRAEGARKIGRFSTNQVYFFTTKRANDGSQVATLASAPGIMQSGDQVLVALPVASRPITVSQRGSSIVISNR